MPGERTRFRRNAFLEATISSETDHMLIEDSIFGRVKTRCCHFCCHRYSNCIAYSLPKGSSGTFYSGRFEKLRMAWCLAVQLPDALDLVHWLVVSAIMEPCVEIHDYVTGCEYVVMASYLARSCAI